MPKYNLKKKISERTDYLQGHLIDRRNLTLGQKAADKITYWAGTWIFIAFILLFIAVWMWFNVSLIPWDPYPFILLNFILSCLAALQAPIILMSQNRELERDRILNRYDYLVNRRAEREIQDMQRDLEEIKSLIKKSNKKNKK